VIYLRNAAGTKAHETAARSTREESSDAQSPCLLVLQQAHALLGKEPAIPVTYLLATPSGWTGPPAYEAVVLDRIASYVDSASTAGRAM
jgi:hypothetical protein